MPPGHGRRDQYEHGLGESRHGQRPDNEEVIICRLTNTRGLSINLPEQDTEYSGYFEAAHDHRLVVKKCKACGLLRGEPGHGCPWCPSFEWEWQTVSGKGTIYSYQIVAHTVMPGFKDWAPFPIALVELDEQSGQPTPGDGSASPPTCWTGI